MSVEPKPPEAPAVHRPAGDVVARGLDHDLAEDLSPRQVELIRSAYQLMGETGVRGLSLQDAGRAAGVSKALVLYYFKSRDNLVLATMRWVLSRTADRIRTAVDRAGTAEDRIVAMIDAIFSHPEANRRFYVVYLDLVDHARRLADFSRLSATFRGMVNALYADVISMGVAQGDFHVEDVEEAAVVVRAIVDGLFLQWILEAEQDRLHDRYRETCKRAVLAYLTRR